jgi:hypothetical protein
MKKLLTMSIALSLTLAMMSTPSTSAYGPVGDPVTKEVTFSNQHPLDETKKVQFGFKFRSQPSPGKETIVDISFNSDNFTESEWQRYRDQLVKDSPIREVFRDFYRYRLKDSAKIETAYATLEFGLFCKNLAGNNLNVSYFKVHRLLAPYASYEIPSSSSSFDSYNQGPYNGRSGSIVLDDKSSVSYSLTSNCGSFWISSVRSYIWIGVSGVWLKIANGELANIGDSTARIPIRTSVWNDLAVELSAFKLKASPTPKVTSAPKSPSQSTKFSTSPSAKANTPKCNATEMNMYNKAKSQFIIGNTVIYYANVIKDAIEEMRADLSDLEGRFVDYTQKDLYELKKQDVEIAKAEKHRDDWEPTLRKLSKKCKLPMPSKSTINK